MYGYKSRTNRVPMTCRADPSVPTPEPLNIWNRGWDSTVNASANLKNECKCALHSHTAANSCSCKLGRFWYRALKIHLINSLCYEMYYVNE